MPRFTEKIDQMTLPLIPLHDAVAFPAIPIDFETDDESAMAAVEAASSGGMLAVLAYIEDDNGDVPTEKDLASVGTLVRIRSSVKDKEKNSVRIICECRNRAQIVECYKNGKMFVANVICKDIALADNGGLRGEAYAREIREQLEEMVGFMNIPTSAVRLTAKNIKDPSLLCDFVASAVLVRADDKQKVLNVFDPFERAAVLITLMKEECLLLSCEKDIQKQTSDRVSRSQRDFFLREQMKVIEEELGEGNDPDDFTRKICDSKMPDELKDKLIKENERLMKTPYGSAEATVARNYLEEVLELPWGKRTKDRVSVEAAEKILNEDHDGLDKVKDRILEFLAVKQLNPELNNQIICLVGPPGTGKTSVAASVAHAMNRKYVRVSLGGVHDEADIRGHRKTYVASMPGRVIAAIKQAGVCNPLMLFDEIDKLTSDSRGDPASAMLEVLDPEQNKSFRDHFIEYPFDLSECFFITTANSLEGIPKPLLDRMEVIELNGYTRREKLAISKNHLIPKQLKRHGLTKRQLKISDEAVYGIIDGYTREAGVRNLERNIASLCRKSARKLLENPDEKKISVTDRNLSDFLGGQKLTTEKIYSEDLVGTVNGLAYTEVGGDLLRIEAAVMEGSGKLELTGSLGDVMKESAHAAYTWVRSAAAEYGINPDFYKTKDVHIHVPEGAVPKDGPSAGVTMVTALVSALSGRAVKRDLAMTGEVTITGRVLAIGGLREKTMAAYAAGIRTVLIPEENLMNLDEVDKEVRESLIFIPVKHVSQVLELALVPADEKKELAVKTGIENTIPAQTVIPEARV